MSDRYTNGFFLSARGQSRVKLRVYQNFMVPWSAKRLSTNRRVWVVDGFAGPGQYQSGDIGSPAIALGRAREVAASGGTLQCLFGDTKVSHRDSLRGLSSRYPEAGAMILSGDFWSSVRTVASMVEDEPALVFVDPFGLLGVQFRELSDLVGRLRSLDLIVNFRSPAASRLAPNYRDRVTRAVGSDDWTPLTITEVFQRNLAEAGGFLPPAALPIRERFAGAVRSELIVAARHSDAYELWNDEIIREVERLASDAGQPLPERDAEIDDVVDRLRGWTSGLLEWKRPEAVAWHCTYFCGDAHSGTVNRAVMRLIAEGTWRRLDRASPIDNDTITHGMRPLFPDSRA